jgi:hypothetical protein
VNRRGFLGTILALSAAQPAPDAPPQGDSYCPRCKLMHADSRGNCNCLPPQIHHRLSMFYRFIDDKKPPPPWRRWLFRCRWKWDCFRRWLSRLIYDWDDYY